MLAIIICLKIWGRQLRGKRIKIHCDNLAICQVLSSGKAKCEQLQDGLREIAFLAATMEFEFKTERIESKSNLLADYLSRWDLDIQHREAFFNLTLHYELQEFNVKDDMFDFCNKW